MPHIHTWKATTPTVQAGDFSWETLHRAVTAARRLSCRTASIHVHRHPRLTAASRNALAGRAVFLMTLMRAASVAFILCSAPARPCLSASGALPAPDAPDVRVEWPRCPHKETTTTLASDCRSAIEAMARLAATRPTISLPMSSPLPPPQSLPFECAGVWTEADDPRCGQGDESAPLLPCADEPHLVSGAAPALRPRIHWSRH